WNKYWQSDGLPPWDAGKVNPALVQLIEEVKWPLPNNAPNSQALIPGCGTGYEVLYLAEQGSPNLTVTGIDMTPSAIEEAKKYRDSVVSSKNITVDSSVSSRAHYKVADFFNFKALPNDDDDDDSKGGGYYDLAFDMRFFCALPPSTRPKIGQRYSEIMKAGSTLITLMYPINPVEKEEGGPPFQVSLKDYMDAFGPYFDLVYYNSKCKTNKKFKDEHIAVWQRRHF
ncbi:hypothetical protein H4219_006269, partial [Mycoemilia scoparia]